MKTDIKTQIAAEPAEKVLTELEAKYPLCSSALLAVARRATSLLSGRFHGELYKEERLLYNSLAKIKMLTVNEHGIVRRRHS